MDMSKLSHGAKLVLGGTIAFLIVSIFNWQQVEISGFTAVGVSMWHGVGVLAGLLALALLVWEGLRLVNIEVALPVGPAMTSAFLAILLVFFTIVKFLVDGEFRTFWAWLGLALAIAITVGAVMNMQAAGQSFSDVRAAVSSGAAAATAATRNVGDSPSASSSSAAPTATGAASEPAQPAERTAENAVETAHDAGDGDDKPPAA
jgi:hypothetical protein